MRRRFHVALTLFLLALCAPMAWGQCVGPNVLLNAGFESPDHPNGTFGAATSWTGAAGGANSGFDPTNAQFTAQVGDQVGAVGNTTLTGSLCQLVTPAMVMGVTYCVDAPAGYRISFTAGTHSTFLRRTSDMAIRCSDTTTVLGVNSLTTTNCSFVADGSDMGNGLEVCLAATSPPGQVIYDEIVATPVELQSFSID